MSVTGKRSLVAIVAVMVVTVFIFIVISHNDYNYLVKKLSRAMYYIEMSHRRGVKASGADRNFHLYASVFLYTLKAVLPYLYLF